MAFMSVFPTVARHFRLNAPRYAAWAVRPAANWSSLLLWVATFSIAALLLLTPAYLAVRTAGVGAEALQLLVKLSTLQTLGRTVLLTAAVTLGSVALAVPLAWLTTSTDLPGRKFWAVVAALPLVLPSYVGAYLLASILGPRGLLQQALEPLFGITRLPDIYGFPGAFLVLTLMSYPYVFLSVRAGLQRLDPSLVEAARSLGLSGWQAFWRVTLPQLRPAVVAGSLLVALYVLRDFGAVTMMRYDTFTRIIYLQYRSYSNRSLAAALALVLVGMTATLLYFEFRTRGKAYYARRSAGAARKMRQVRLGAWRWPALLFCLVVALVALALPAGGLLYWLIRGLGNGQSLLTQWQPAGNSLLVSLGAALLAIGASIPVAVAAVRRPGRWSTFLERLTYASFALPGIVIALALVFFGATYATSLYQTLPMLLAAYVILFLPQAVGSTRTSLLQVSSSLEEAGRSLGHSSMGVLRRVTLPLIRPGMLAGGALVFLTCMKELPATLLLSPTGFRTLSTAVWGSITDAFFAQAALPALLLILLSSVPLALLTLRDK